MSSLAAEHQRTDVSAPQPEFVKALTLTDATMLVAGSMIGSGIFIVSADIGRTVGSPFWLLAAWVLTGVITVLGALAYGELAGMYPRAGGQYVFLRESMGPLMGFLYGWTLFLVIQTGTIAAVAVAFGRFLGVLVPAIGPERFSWFPRLDFAISGGAVEAGLSPQRLVALISIWILTAINLRGVREGKLVQTTLTVVKTSALALLVLLGLTIGRNADVIAANFGPGRFVGSIPLDSVLVLAFGAALVGSLFSSDAWNNVTFAAAEVKNAQRNLPLALLLGTGLVSLLYVLANVAYLNTLPLGGVADGATVAARGIQFATQDRVGTAAAEVLFGPSGTVLMACAILISTFGCNNGLILAGARVYYAMARDGLFFRRAGVLNKNRVPAVALVLQTVWASLLTLPRTVTPGAAGAPPQFGNVYTQLLEYIISVDLVFYVLMVGAVIVMRRKAPDIERPYRTFGYPLVPLVYIILAMLFIIDLAILAPSTSGIGYLLVFTGIPIYFVWRRR